MNKLNELNKLILVLGLSLGVTSFSMASFPGASIILPENPPQEERKIVIEEEEEEEEEYVPKDVKEVQAGIAALQLNPESPEAQIIENLQAKISDFQVALKSLQTIVIELEQGSESNQAEEIVINLEKTIETVQEIVTALKSDIRTIHLKIRELRQTLDTERPELELSDVIASLPARAERLQVIIGEFSVVVTNVQQAVENNELLDIGIQQDLQTQIVNIRRELRNLQGEELIILRRVDGGIEALQIAEALQRQIAEPRPDGLKYVSGTILRVDGDGQIVVVPHEGWCSCIKKWIKKAAQIGGCIIVTRAVYDLLPANLQEGINDLVAQGVICVETVVSQTWQLAGTISHPFDKCILAVINYFRK